MRFFATPRHLVEAIAEEAQPQGCEVVERDGRVFLIINVDCECGTASVTEIDLTAVAERVWGRAACGITHIEPGTETDGEILCWQDEDLCSRCHERLNDQLVQDAARYRHIRNRQFRAVDIAAGGVFAGIVHANLIIGGEDLDRAIDAEMGADVPAVEPLERRLAKCLAECVDTPLLTGKDEPGGFNTPLDIRLGFFRPDLSERAADLLEEAGI